MDETCGPVPQNGCPQLLQEGALNLQAGGAQSLAVVGQPGVLDHYSHPGA